MTLETAAALKTCGAVFTTLRSRALHARLSALCRKVINGRSRSPGETVREVLGVLKTHSKAAFLTYGNPFFLNRAAVELRRAAEKKGIKVKVLEGVSSVDGLLNFLRVTDDRGYDLRLVNIGEFDRRPAITADTDTLYFMAGGPAGGRHAANVRAFLSALRRLYPPSFPVLLANCPDEMTPEGRLVPSTVGGLRKDLRRADLATTLFVGRLKGSAHEKSA